MLLFFGTVRAWFADRGFGFLSRDDGAGRDIFVHINDLRASDIDDLNVGYQLSFEITADKRDPSRVRATNITRVA
jgi:cold shock CspA family protein